MEIRDYDVIVIGAGPVGENVADRTTKGGLKTVIVETELVGGECSYWACMPSKAMLHSIGAVTAAQRLDGAKQAVTGPVDAAGVFARRTLFTHDWDDASQVDWLDSAGIDLVRGHGRLAAPKEVLVSTTDGDEVVLRAEHAVVVCTGSAAAIPDTPGLAESSPWTSRDATAATAVPESLAIIGGGVVGCEMATAYAGLGSQVTVLSRGPLLAGVESFAGELVQQTLEDSGVTVMIGAEAESVHRAEGSVVIDLVGGQQISTSELLVATGRRPRTDDLGLDKIGLRPGSWLDVDDTLRSTDVDWLYGVGDVNHRALLTHQGKYQARAAGDAIVARAQGADVDDGRWGKHVATADHQHVPQVTFTDPEVASVGLTERQALDSGLTVRTVDIDLAGVAGASTVSDDYRGQARAVIDVQREVLVGATFVGSGVAELLHSATVAIVGEVPLDRLWHAVPSYPTISEVWLRWLEALCDA